MSVAVISDDHGNAPARDWLAGLPATVTLELDGVDADVVVCGNTHMQFDRLLGSRRVVNAGSVGMPYGGTGAFWVLLDGDVEFCRTEHDLAAAAQAIRADSDWELADDFARENVLTTPSRDEALAFFESLG